MLAKPFSAFPPPTPQTKAAFDQRTSAINVTPSASSRYDIKEVKEDALWLSRVAQLDEVSALRIVVVECQSRDITLLLQPFSEEELVGLREASGNSSYSSATPISLLSQAAHSKQVEDGFDSKPNRQYRILQTYLSERRHFLKCVDLILYASYASKKRRLGGEEATGKVQANSWIELIGSEMYQRYQPHDDIMIASFNSIKTNFENLANGTDWLGDQDGTEDINLEWAKNQLVEATHTLEIVFCLIDTHEEIASSQVILAWFRLMQSCQLFDEIEVVSESHFYKSYLID